MDEYLDVVAEAAIYHALYPMYGQRLALFVVTLLAYHFRVVAFSSQCYFEHAVLHFYGNHRLYGFVALCHQVAGVVLYVDDLDAALSIQLVEFLAFAWFLHYLSSQIHRILVLY